MRCNPFELKTLNFTPKPEPSLLMMTIDDQKQKIKEPDNHTNVPPRKEDDDELTSICEKYEITPILYVSLFNENPNDRFFILKLEKDIVDFINTPAVESWKLNPLNSYYRLLTHQIAGYYNLGHILSKDGSSMVIFKKNTSKVNTEENSKNKQKAISPEERLSKTRLSNIPNELPNSQIFSKYKSKTFQNLIGKKDNDDESSSGSANELKNYKKYDKRKKFYRKSSVPPFATYQPPFFMGPIPPAPGPQTLANGQFFNPYMSQYVIPPIPQYPYNPPPQYAESPNPDYQTQSHLKADQTGKIPQYQYHYQYQYQYHPHTYQPQKESKTRIEEEKSESP
ncbi:hypothetical protein PP7435_CHR1-0624 [Komagataella phaffii CBS 7435]|uniref:R3H domain-containing protein n=2 Tax=Komagataella phaffii TaxID=460519 RepID=C4QWQ8_KOMPG|nr:uncharacterized protein PAS_chr1-1_0304 [Komagataella phaffii GS115]AOA61042.1 GQ67_02889T0 [Komagataella phaffii]CAH2446443.1 Hypothetical protein BQ9382_C1-3211 [Komagataella phaffii CBS 7435]CAY67681.1 Protein of unknown function, identified as a high copy suppressor of psk1 psk2 mutations [Komagataella phaffii GS115]CCA36773.1 hypothetical protein PP7435_CHR1-0624 [Komagataella phaffii CBS 7435]